MTGAATERFYIEDFMMMPGETRTLTYTLDNEETPFGRIVISGFNLER